MAIKLRWKLKPIKTGLRGFGTSARSSILHDGEKTYAHVIYNRVDSGWYWVSGWDSGVPYSNTCNQTVATVEEAKAEALAFVKSHLAD